MPSRKTGEENRLSIFVRDGNISSTIILRLGAWLSEVHIVLDRAIQVDKDRAVAAGASYGGYAIKCVLGVDFDAITAKDVPSWIQSNPDFGFGFKALVCHDGVYGVSWCLVRD